MAVLIFLLLIQGCSNLANNASQETTSSNQSRNSLIGSWKDEATKKIYVFTDTEMIVYNLNNSVYNRATYTIDKDLLTVTYSIYHGLLMGGELIDKFKFSISLNGCDLTQIDDTGATAAPIKLIK